MEIWYLSFGIGGLLLATLVFNDIAETIEHKARMHKLSIYRLKRQHDEVGDYIDRLKEYFLPEEIKQFLYNEMLSFLNEIEEIDPLFENLEQLKTDVQSNIKDPNIVAPEQEDTSLDPTEEVDSDSSDVEEPSTTTDDDADSESESDIDEDQANHPFKIINSERTLEHFVAMLRGFTIYVQELDIIAASPEDKQHILDLLLTFKYENINQFYSLKSQNNIKIHKYARALTYAKKLHTLLVISGMKNERLKEIGDYSVELQVQISQMIKDKERKAQKKSEEKLEKKKQDELKKRRLD